MSLAQRVLDLASTLGTWGQGVDARIDALEAGGGGGGTNRVLTWNGLAYETRPASGSVVFLGTQNPDSLGLMQDGDVWVNPSDFAEGASGGAHVYLEGVPLWTYGSSFTVEPPFLASAGMRFDSLVAARLRMGTATTFGNSGRSIRDVGKRVVGGNGVANAPWLPTRRGIGVIDTWVNDVAAYAAGNIPRAFIAKDVSGIKANLAAALAMMSAQTLIDNTTGTKTGTWNADSAGNDRSGGSNSQATTVGAVMTFSGVSVPEDHFFFLTHTLDPAAFTVATVEVLVDGAIARTITREEMYSHSSVEGQTVQTGNAAFRIPCTPGSHTVAIRHAGAAAEALLVDAIVVPRPVAKRSPVFVIQDALPRAITGGPFYTTQAQIDILAGNWAQLLAAYNSVLAEFPNAVFVPTTLDALAHYGSDGLHPNDRGMQAKADELLAAINAWTVVNGRPDNLYGVV